MSGETSNEQDIPCEINYDTETNQGVGRAVVHTVSDYADIGSAAGFDNVAVGGVGHELNSPDQNSAAGVLRPAERCPTLHRRTC